MIMEDLQRSKLYALTKYCHDDLLICIGLQLMIISTIDVWWQSETEGLSVQQRCMYVVCI